MDTVQVAPEVVASQQVLENPIASFPQVPQPLASPSLELAQLPQPVGVNGVLDPNLAWPTDTLAVPGDQGGAQPGLTLEPVTEELVVTPPLPEQIQEMLNKMRSATGGTVELPRGATSQNPIDVQLGPHAAVPPSQPQPSLPPPVFDPSAFWKDVKTIPNLPTGGAPAPSIEPSLEPSSEPKVSVGTDFCSKASFTLDEAEAHARQLAVKGAKPRGFRGAPYIPLAPWACDRKVPVGADVNPTSALPHGFL